MLSLKYNTIVCFKSLNSDKSEKKIMYIVSLRYKVISCKGILQILLFIKTE